MANDKNMMENAEAMKEDLKKAAGSTGFPKKPWFVFAIVILFLFLVGLGIYFIISKTGENEPEHWHVKLELRAPEGRTPTWSIRAVSDEGTDVKVWIARKDGEDYEQVQELLVDQVAPEEAVPPENLPQDKTEFADIGWTGKGELDLSGLPEGDYTVMAVMSGSHKGRKTLAQTVHVGERKAEETDESANTLVHVDGLENVKVNLSSRNNKLYITGYLYCNDDYPFQKVNLIVNEVAGRDIKNPVFKADLKNGASEAARAEMEDLNYGSMNSKNQGVFAIEVPREEEGKWDLTEGGEFTIEVKFTFAKSLKQTENQIIVNRTVMVTVVTEAEGGGEVFTRPEDQLSLCGYE